MGAGDGHLSPGAMQVLLNHAWPGNIRELRNLLQRAIALSDDGTLGVEHFPGLADFRPDEERVGDGLTLAQLEDLHIKHVLDQYEGDTATAADALGISRAALYRRLRKDRGG